MKPTPEQIEAAAKAKTQRLLDRQLELDRALYNVAKHTNEALFCAVIDEARDSLLAYGSLVIRLAAALRDAQADSERLDKALARIVALAQDEDYYVSPVAGKMFALALAARKEGT